ncbi:hypothetical protein CDAR_279611 [Caerostris darwini]|uniref:Uncharacterized protein n=1 Tax=Caerostris darwini TaxID=1538125 RepID=A0AAV4VML5_9ARAC|nr:hypothetical protein CDAR_279611 [Caerostris darwini]
MISNDRYSRGAVRPYNSRPNEPLELAADPVLGLPGGYGYGYGSGRNGYGVNGYGYGTGSYGGNGNLGYGRSLGYNGGYGGVVNFGAPLIGGAIRGYDSRFVNGA